MHFTQYYLGCLSQASYLIGDEATGIAAVVDPRRDVDTYLADAAAAGLRIRYVIETHLHADFLSGHLELAEAAGATVLYGAEADVHFPHRPVADGERIALGRVVLEFRATPGHTPESICVVVWDGAAGAAGWDGAPGGGDAAGAAESRAPSGTDLGTPYGVLTGDTLFIGDVGRPDLGAAAGRPVEDMAAELYRSLRAKLLTLPDETRIFPAHGAGSACGKSLSTETVSTIGEQRRCNYALQAGSVEEFVALVTEGQAPAPSYFAHLAELNREPHRLLHADDPVPLLTLDEVLARQADGAVVLDVRPPEVFARGHLNRSINVGLAGRFAEYVAELVDADCDIVVVCDPGAAREAEVRLSRVGLDRTVGALDRPAAAFAERPDVVRVASSVTADQLADAMTSVPGLVVLDVRGAGERAAGAIVPSAHIALASLAERRCELDPDRATVTYCAGGYRSSIAASFLRASGFADASDLVGGFPAWGARDGRTTVARSAR